MVKVSGRQKRGTGVLQWPRLLGNFENIPIEVVQARFLEGWEGDQGAEPPVRRWNQESEVKVG